MSSNSRKILIIGAGGAGVDALCVAQRMLAAGAATFAEIAGFLDDDPALAGKVIEGIPVLGSIAESLGKDCGSGHLFHCAIGSNLARKRVALLMEGRGWQPATLVDPSAVVANSARVGEGAYLGAQCFVGPQAMVGRHVIVNAGASLGHHSRCRDYVQVCPGGRISGNAQLGEGVFVGSNGVVAPGVTVGEWATVGAGSLAIRDVPGGALALGVPARLLPPAP